MINYKIKKIFNNKAILLRIKKLLKFLVKQYVKDFKI